IQDDEVEEWIVKAIAAKQLDCKMDQLNQTIIVRLSVRAKPVGVALRSKVSMWRGNVANVITTIQANKLAEDVSQNSFAPIFKARIFHNLPVAVLRQRNDGTQDFCRRHL
ncbi:hypothetical protein MKW98_027431, partial [Papaver atlanticum]